MKSTLEKAKMLSDLARSLCEKFEMNPYVISIYPEANEIFIQGNKYLNSIGEKLIEDDYKLIREFTDSSNSYLFQDYEKFYENVRVVFTLVQKV